MNQFRKIKLTRNKYALVDSDVFKYLNRWKWYYSNSGYAVRNIKNKMIYMHKLVIDVPIGKQGDHINGNRLDNRRKNLRVVTHSQNQQNRKIGSTNTSGYKGVCWHKPGKGYWKAFIKVNGNHKHLGLFKTKREAAKAYDEAAKLYFGDFGKLNFKGGITN